MERNIKEISTGEMLNILDQPEMLIVDIRSVNAYNGWPVKNEKRGGHIKGAISFPFEWTRFKFELQEILFSKGIMRNRPLVLYGYDEEETNEMAEKLSKGGYEDIKVYHHFQDEWSANEDLPMDKLENYKHLVFPQWLKELQDGGNPLHYEGKKFVVCHSHYDIPEDYKKGHIPGAVSLNTLMLESPETWNRHEPGKIKDSLEKMGIDKDTTVILYGRFSFPDNKDKFPGQSAGHLGAIRCAVIMMYAGVKDVKVLNGGLAAWENAGYEISRKPTEPEPVNDFGAEIPLNPQYFVDTPEAKELLDSDDGDLVCVRSWEEYTGKVSGYNYIEKTGRIPGAIFGFCGSDAYHMENYRNLDHTTREFHEIEANWSDAGISRDKHNAFYCGTGWRGSEAFYNAWLMGWPRVSVYDGGWFEWSSDPANPIVTGEPYGEMENVEGEAERK